MPNERVCVADTLVRRFDLDFGLLRRHHSLECVGRVTIGSQE